MVTHVRNQITALSHALRRPVHIFTATAPRLVIGEDYGDATPIRLAYALVFKYSTTHAVN